MNKKNILLGLAIVLLVFAGNVTAQRTGRGNSEIGSISSNIGAEAVDDARGALLESVDESGRASRFGLQEGDIVLSIDGQEVTDAESFSELVSAVERGAAVSIQVLRDGEETTVGREARSFGVRNEDDEEETPVLSSNIGATAVDDARGALLESVDESGRASRFGLQQGDIVLSIDGQEVTDAESFSELMSAVERGAAVSIEVLRENVQMTVGRESRRGRGNQEAIDTQGGFRNSVLTVNVISELLDLARQNDITQLIARLETLLEEVETPTTSNQRRFGARSSNIGASAVDDARGALLESVDESGRASRFGLQEGDIVLSIDGQAVTDSESFIELIDGVERGAAVSIEVLRDGQRTTTGREATGRRNLED